MQAPTAPDLADSMLPMLPPQQASRFLKVLEAYQHKLSPAAGGPAQPQQDSEARMQETHTQMPVVETLARTIDNLSRLPGAADLISPTVAAVVKGVLAHSAAQSAQPHLSAVTTHNPSNISTKGIHKQLSLGQPGTPPGTPPLAKVPVAAPFAALQALLGSAGASAAPLPAQQARPKSLFKPSATGMPYNSPAGDNINISGDHETHALADYTTQGPRSKRVCTDTLQAHHAMALPFSNEPFLQPLATITATRCRSTDDLLEAAEALTSLTAMGQSPMGLIDSSAFCPQPQPHPPSFAGLEPLAAAAAGAAASRLKAVTQASRKRSTAALLAAFTPQPQAAAVAAAANRPAAKPRTIHKADRKSADRKSANYFQAEAKQVKAEVQAALRAMWQSSQSLPVFCQNRETGVRAEGTFKIINGQRRIVLISGPLHQPGTVMTPADFEREGDRLSTRNWQMSVCVAGLYAKAGCTKELKLGAATRILEVHA